MNNRIMWRYPYTELEHNFLSMVFWRDVYKNNYKSKSQSKYYNHLRRYVFECPNCNFYTDHLNDRIACENCCLRVESKATVDDKYLPCDYFLKWVGLAHNNNERMQYAYMIYKRLQNKVLELIKNSMLSQVAE